MAFAKRSRLRKPRLRTFTVLIRLWMPSAGSLVGRRMIALTIPQRCSRIMRAVFRTGCRAQAPLPTPATGGIRPAPRFCSDDSRGSWLLPSAPRPGRSGGCPLGA